MTNTCILNLLKYIYLLQNNSICRENEGCSKPFLGPTISNTCYNTRVISLYKKDGSIFSVEYTDSEGVIQTSSLFRITDITNESVTLLILSVNENTYSSTNRYITVNTNCICAVRCITDTCISL